MNIRLTLFLIASLLLMLACQHQKQSSFVQKPIFVQDTIFHATIQAKTEVLKDSTVSRNYEYVIEKGEKLLLQYKDSLSYDSTGWAMLHHRLGVAYSRATPQDSIFYKKMKGHFDTAIALRKAIPMADWANSYLNLGIGENEYGKYKAASVTLKNAFDSFSEKDTLRYISVRRQQLCAHTKLNEKDLVEKYFKSIEYYYSHIVTKNKVVQREYAGSLHYYASFLSKNKNYKDAIKYYLQAQQLFKEIDKKGDKAGVNLELSHALMQDNQSAAAIPVLNELINYYKGQKNDKDLGQSYTQLSECYIAQKNYAQALFFSEQKALPILKQQQDRTALGACYFTSAIAYSGKGDYSKALENSQNALKSYLFDFENNDVTQNPSEKQLKKCPVKSNLIDVFEQKAGDLYKLATQSKSRLYLESAWQTHQTLNTLISLIREEISSEKSKIELGEKQDTTGVALKIARQLYAQTNDAKYQEQAYYLVQNTKAQVFNEYQQGEKGKAIANVSDADLKREKDLLAACTELYKAQLDNPKDESISNKILLAEQNFYSCRAEIEKKYPLYYEYKYNHKPLEIKEIQARLKNNTAILDYMDTSDSLHIFCITKQHFTWKTIAINSTHLADADTLKNILNEPNNTIETPKSKQFLDCANRLYQLLIKPMNSELMDITSLRFVPSGWIYNIAFASLCTESYSENWAHKEAPYLIRKYASSYLFSVKDLQTLDPKPNRNNISVGSFGNSYEDERTSKSLRSSGSCLEALATTRGGGKLLYATKEAEQVYAQWGKGNCFLNEKATKENFKKYCESENYSILHIAMHGIPECGHSENTQLLFAKNDDASDNMANLHEIAGMKMYSDLAVLSACHSGDGSLKNREGVISLGRAFAMAGCRSLIMSNSYVIDDASPEIFKNFYANINDNQDKDIALQQAVIKYLDDKKDAFRIPYRWANFKLWGNTAAIKGKETSLFERYKWWIVASSIFIFFTFYVLKMNKNTK